MGGAQLFTGRNEVLAKVIFLHLSVILFTGGALDFALIFRGGALDFALIFGGGCSRFCSNFSGGAPDFALIFRGGGSSKFSGGGGGFPPEYGQRSAGTHPTGMHSCSF